MKLRQWYNVYCTSSEVPPPDALLDCLRPRIRTASIELESLPNWTRGFIRFSSDINQLLVHRTWAGDEEFDAQMRKLLNIHPLSESEPIPDLIPRHIKNCVQSFHIFPITSQQTRAARVCEQICGYLCRNYGGLIHVFQEGFFNCDGESIYPRNPMHRLKTA